VDIFSTASVVRQRLNCRSSLPVGTYSCTRKRPQVSRDGQTASGGVQVERWPIFFCIANSAAPAPGKRKARRSVRIHGTNTDDNLNRTLLGSLVDSYDFKENGMVKKTISIKVQDAHHHLVSYYSLDDANKLATPRDDCLLKNFCVPEALLHQAPFKNHLDDDGTWTEKLGAYPSSCPGSYPQYYTQGLPYSIPQYQVPKQQDPTA